MPDRTRRFDLWATVPILWTLLLIVLALQPLISMTVTHRSLSGERVADQAAAEAIQETAEETVDDAVDALDDANRTTANFATEVEKAAATDATVPAGVKAAADSDVDEARESADDVKEDLAAIREAKDEAGEIVHVYWAEWDPDVDALALWLLVVAGILGGALRSLALAAGKDTVPSDRPGRVDRLWMWFLGRPVAGAAAAFALYVAIRAGLLNVGIDSATLNAFGLAAVGIAAGLWGERLFERLAGMIGSEE